MTYWKDSLLVGVSKIDEQHKKLVSAIDELMDACSKGRGRATIEKTLSFVIEYTKVHFADEEALQAQCGYPGLTVHKQMHTKFIANISELKKDLDKNGPSIVLTGNINRTLVDWLIKHITTEDKKIGEHMKLKSK